MFAVTELMISQRRQHITILGYAITFTSLGHSNEFFLQSAQPFDFSAHIAELGCRNLSSCLARTIRVFLELDEGKDSFY